MKKFCLALLLASYISLLLAGLMSTPASAEPGQPGPYGTKLNFGFFKGKQVNFGDQVFPNGLQSNNAQELIDRIRFELRPGAPYQYQIGASFIVQTMLGGGNRSYMVDPNGPVFAEWEKRVRYVDSYGGINFNEGYSFRVNSYYQASVQDDAFFTMNNGNYVWTPGSSYAGQPVGNSIVFRDPSGKVVYAIRRACANPVGEVIGLPFTPPPPPQWYFDGTSYVDGPDRLGNGAWVTGRKDLTVWPGDWTTFFHFGWNYGPDTGYTQWWTYLQPPAGGRQVRGYSGGVIGVPGNSWINNGAPANWNAYQIPGNAQPGERYCQYIGFFWWAWNSQTGRDSTWNQACATIGYNYSLVPQTTNAAGQLIASPGETVNFQYTMNKTGITRSQANTSVAYKQFIAPPGMNVNMSWDYRDKVPSNCANPYAPVCVTDAIPAYVDPNPFTAATTDMSVAPRVAPPPLTIPLNTPAGSKVCRLLAVSPATGPPSSILDRWSRPACVTIGKYPTTQLYGGDVFSGGNYEAVDASCSTPAGLRGIVASGARTIGTTTIASFGEYGVFSLDGVSGFASGSAYSSNTLTFKNTGGLGSFYGSGTPRRCLTDFDAMFRPRLSSTRSAAGLDIAALPDGVYQINGNLTIPPLNNLDSDVVLLVNGSVTITGNVGLSDGNICSKNNGNGKGKGNGKGGCNGEGKGKGKGNSSQTSIPRLVIAATGRIVITSGVTEVNAWLQTRDTLYTCDDNSGGGRLTTAKCNKPLTITGLVSAARLSLRRTAGGEMVSPGPAERFVAPPYAWVSAYTDAQKAGGAYRATYQLELPPRY